MELTVVTYILLAVRRYLPTCDIKLELCISVGVGIKVGLVTDIAGNTVTSPIDGSWIMTRLAPSRKMRTIV